jgi:uncharacterized protein
MKKYYAILTIFILMLASFSSASIFTESDILNFENSNFKDDSNQAFSTFFMEGFKNYDIDISQNSFLKKTYMVEMRDGIKLATDVYLPIFRNKPQGAIFLRTPYGKDDLNELGIFSALIGWAMVIQDVRGRQDSEGIPSGFRTDYRDGPDTLSWISSQDWSNGKVATLGPSAMGITQYFMAGENPPELACQGIMVASPNLHKHAIYQGGQFRKQLVTEWLKGQDSLFLLDEIFENENYTLDFWTNVSLDDDWPNVNVPAIHLGGWYDCFLGGIIDGFYGYQHLAGPGAQGKSKLIIGPWTHSGYTKHKQGQLTYPENSMRMVELIFMFLEIANKYVKDKDNNFEELPTVQYYVMGDVNVIDAPGNEWRHAEDWPIACDTTNWYFHENGVLSIQSPENYSPLEYSYDPTNPVPTIGGQNLEMPPGPYDQTSIEARADVLVFTSEILTDTYEATGPIKAKLFVSSDCYDTDFTVKLTDVYPDGRSMLITDGILRMRNRNTVEGWEFIEPEEIYQIEVDLWATSYIWNTGHKIRVSISSSNYPRFLANPNTIDPIAKNTTYNIAQNTIYIDSEHPSCIVLPEIEQPTPSNPPETPKKPFGLKRIKVGRTQIYSSSSIDPDDDQIYLLFDWGDGKSSGWLGPYNSGEKVRAFHKWTENGSYEIRVKAKDVTGAQSNWSEPSIVALPYSRFTFYELFLKILQKLPIINNFYPNFKK